MRLALARTHPPKRRPSANRLGSPCILRFQIDLSTDALRTTACRTLPCWVLHCIRTGTRCVRAFFDSTLFGSIGPQRISTKIANAANRIADPAGSLAGKTTARPTTHDLAYEHGQDEERSNHGEYFLGATGKNHTLSLAFVPRGHHVAFPYGAPFSSTI